MRGLFARIWFVVVTCWLFAGCTATGDAVVTGSKRKPVDPSVVEIYAQPPARYEPIGQISASCGSGLTRESSRDYALEELKAQAAKIGANAVLSVTADVPAASRRKSGTHVSVAGQAIYVPPSARSPEHVQKFKIYEAEMRRSKSLFQAIAGEKPEPPDEEIREQKPAAPTSGAPPTPTAMTPPAPPSAAPAGSSVSGAGELFEALTENAARAYESGDYLSAAAQYEKAVRMNWNDPKVNYNLATVYFQLGKYAEAKPYYQTAAYLNPADPDAHLFLGYTHFYLKDTPAAVREWKKVLELDPGNAAARENLESAGVER